MSHMPERIQTLALWITAIGAAIMLVWRAIKTTWHTARTIQDMWMLVESELQPNGGKSLKDTVGAIQIRVDELERLRLDDEAARVERQAHVDEVFADILARLD